MGLITDALGIQNRHATLQKRRAYETTKDNAKALYVATALRESGTLRDVRAQGGGVFVSGPDLDTLLALAADIEELAGHNVLSGEADPGDKLNRP